MKPNNQKEKKINKPTGLIFDKSAPPREERVKVKYDDFKKALDKANNKKLGACCCNGNLIEVTQKANNLEDLWDWCCTKVYQLNNGEDVWKQINKVHQLALKEQREKEMCRLVKILNKMKWKNIRKTMLLSYRNGSLGFHTGSGFDHHELTIGTLEEYGNYHYNEAISDVLQLLKEKK